MAEHLLAVLFALASALALLFAVLWLRALAAYEDRSKAFERAAADCVRLEGERELALLWFYRRDPFHCALLCDKEFDSTGALLGRIRALSEQADAAEAEDEQHAHVEHLREAREVEQHQEEKHGA